MTTYYEFGATVPLTFTAPVDADVVLHVTAPDGTETEPVVSNVGTAWSGSVVGNQYDAWQFVWIATGTGDDIDQGSFVVGLPVYAPLSVLKSNLNVADTSKDSVLTQKLDGASRSVEEYCDGRRFYLDDAATARTYTTSRRVRRQPDGSQRLAVDDIGALTDLLVEVGDGTTWTTVTTYETWPDNALAKRTAIQSLIALNGEWASARRVRVTARWGWPAVPAAVYEATLLQAMRLFRRKDSPEGVAGSADWGLIRVPNLDPDVKALLSYLATPFKAA